MLIFQSWIQEIESTIADRNLTKYEAFHLIKDFSKGSAKDNINYYLEAIANAKVDGLFLNLRQVFSAAEDSQQMLAEFYSQSQGAKKNIKEFGEALLQIFCKIMTTNKDFKNDIDSTLKAHFSDALHDHYHQALA